MVKASASETKDSTNQRYCCDVFPKKCSTGMPAPTTPMNPPYATLPAVEIRLLKARKMLIVTARKPATGQVGQRRPPRGMLGSQHDQQKRERAEDAP